MSSDGTGGGGDGTTYAVREGEDWVIPNDPDAQYALDSFLSGGGCVSGWDIYVDSVQRCDDGMYLF